MKAVAIIATSLALVAQANAQQCAPGQVIVSVEGGQNGCAWPPICVANIRANCPPNSYCDIVRTGVYGCKPGSGGNPGTCLPGQLPVSVEGRGTGCAYAPICAGVQGNCPDGSECGYVRTGVLGCKPRGAGNGNFYQNPGVFAQQDSGLAYSKMFANQLFFRPNAQVQQFGSYMNAGVTCPAGQYSVSVQGGVDGCAPGPICVGNTRGNCPAGSTCGVVQTGVYGCLKDGGQPPVDNVCNNKCLRGNYGNNWFDPLNWNPSMGDHRPPCWTLENRNGQTYWSCYEYLPNTNQCPQWTTQQCPMH